MIDIDIYVYTSPETRDSERKKENTYSFSRFESIVKSKLKKTKDAHLLNQSKYKYFTQSGYTFLSNIVVNQIKYQNQISNIKIKKVRTYQSPLLRPTPPFPHPHSQKSKNRAHQKQLKSTKTSRDHPQKADWKFQRISNQRLIFCFLHPSIRSFSPSYILPHFISFHFIPFHPPNNLPPLSIPSNPPFLSIKRAT